MEKRGLVMFKEKILKHWEKLGGNKSLLEIEGFVVTYSIVMEDEDDAEEGMDDLLEYLEDIMLAGSSIVIKYENAVGIIEKLVHEFPSEPTQAPPAYFGINDNSGTMR